jgi:hypothetical protein
MSGCVYASLFVPLPKFSVRGGKPRENTFDLAEVNIIADLEHWFISDTSRELLNGTRALPFRTLPRACCSRHDGD